MNPVVYEGGMLMGGLTKSVKDIVRYLTLDDVERYRFGIDLKSYEITKEAGKVVNQGGYHKPYNSNCGCKLETPKGAYRDTTIEVWGNDGYISAKVHYYHQTPVVVDTIMEGQWVQILNNGGYSTKTTKERINRYLKEGRIIQRDYEWYYEDVEGAKYPFVEGMVIRVSESKIRD